jgi:hypothetical protein
MTPSKWINPMFAAASVLVFRRGLGTNQRPERDSPARQE